DELYDDVGLVEPNAKELAEGATGYARVQLEALLEIDLVLTMQAQLSEQMLAYGGRCESWEVAA
ncbi:MAG: hypothetical protein ACPGSC_13665, partial [Granulosicoccaceae bacterium]